MTTPVAVLLGRKGSAVHTVEESANVSDAVHLMNEKRVGCVVVTRGGRLTGIFTERDVLIRVVGSDRDPKTTVLAAVMTTNPLTVAPETTIAEVMEIFTEKRCRHLPVLAGDTMEGLVSIGDVSRWLTDSHRAEAEHLRQYISGGYPI